MAEARSTLAGAGGFEQHPGFAGWPRDALRRLNVKSVRMEYSHGGQLYCAGDPVRGLYLLRSGRVDLLLAGDRGKFIVSHSVEPGGTIGLGPTVSGKPYEFTARALGPTVLLFVPREEFVAILSRFPSATISVSEVLSSEVELAYRRVIALRA